MNNSGQAFLEYLLMLVFGVLIASNLFLYASESISSNFGRLAHELSNNLSTGSCAQDCFFAGYENDQVK